jgi:hypothetical protein
MDRLFVKRPGQHLSGSSSAVRGESLPLNHPTSGDDVTVSSGARADDVPRSSSAEAKPDVGGLSEAKRCPIPGLGSLTWQPAAKRVLDAVCVTDVTTCGGFTVTVRESSVVDGFFRSQETTQSST